MSLHVTANGQLVAGTMGHATWTVTGADGAWYRLARGMPSINNHIAAIAGVPGHPRTLFAGSLSNGVYRTTNDGSQWTNISDGLASTSNANTVLSLAYDGQRHTLYAGTADGVYILNPA